MANTVKVQVPNKEMSISDAFEVIDSKVVLDQRGQPHRDAPYDTVFNTFSGLEAIFVFELGNVTEEQAEENWFVGFINDLQEELPGKAFANRRTI